MPQQLVARPPHCPLRNNGTATAAIRATRNTGAADVRADFVRGRREPDTAALPENLAAIGADELRVIEVTPHDYLRMAELLTTYAS